MAIGTPPPSGLLRRIARRSRAGKPVFPFPYGNSDNLDTVGDWLEELIDATKTVTFAQDDYSDAYGTRLAQAAKAARASACIKTSPYASQPWLSSRDPRDADSNGWLDYSIDLTRQVRDKCYSYGIPILAVAADSEIFNYLPDTDPLAPTWNAAMVTKYNTYYDRIKEILPEAHLSWYSRGWIRWIGATPNVAQVLTKYIHFTLEEKGDDISPVIYRPEFFEQERAVMKASAALGRTIGQSVLCPWFSIGFGSHYAPTFRSENWKYPVEAAYRWGRHLLRENDAVKMVFTYPAPGKSPYYWDHFEPFMTAGRVVRRFWNFSGNTNYSA